MKSSKKLLVLLLLLCPIVACAQSRPAICEVRPLWVGGGVRSANLGSLATFQLEGKEGRTQRSFQYKDTGLVITAGVDFVFDYSKYPKSKTTPYELRLAITVSNKEEKEIFESVESAEASTRYDKKWNLTVSKNVNFDNRVYIFTLSCWDAANAFRK